MGLVTLAYAVSVFWLAIHAAHRFFTHRFSAASVLPTSTSSSHARLRPPTWLHHLRISLHGVHLKLDTTFFNNTHDAWSSSLRKPRHATFRRVVARFYDVGSVLGVIGMCIAVALLWMTVIKLLVGIFAGGSRGIPEFSSEGITKRSFDLDESPPEVQPNAAAPLQLILPGVTVPLIHLPVLLFSLFFTQVVHELGHAIVAALESIPLTSVGTSLTLLIPSAYISLPSSSSISSPARLRLISSGAWHNLVFFGLLWSAKHVGVGNTLARSVGYKDVGMWGRVVLSVDEDSPLHAHLPPLSIITELDDQSLTSSSSEYTDIWTKYLSFTPSHSNSHKKEIDSGLGWCVDAQWFLGHTSSECCHPSSHSHEHSSSSVEACFSTGLDSPDEKYERCLPPLSVLQPGLPPPSHSSQPKATLESEPAPVDLDNKDGREPQRCRESAHCASHNLCVKLSQEEELLRIKFVVLPHGSGRDEDEVKTVVWSGPREELLEEVTVGTYLPRYAFLPLWLPNAVAVLFRYVYTLNGNNLSLMRRILFIIPFIHFATTGEFATPPTQLHLNTNTLPLPIQPPPPSLPRRLPTARRALRLHPSSLRLHLPLHRGSGVRISKCKYTAQRAAVEKVEMGEMAKEGDAGRAGDVCWAAWCVGVFEYLECDFVIALRGVMSVCDTRLIGGLADRYLRRFLSQVPSFDHSSPY
ncbi:hypothetical protein BC629DRAFT_469876 [Irpex lacteus]|nr:hypothetical protein BC629DRAFT_469876 [Irpex lacteus]